MSSSQLQGPLFYPKTRDSDFLHVRAGPAGLLSAAADKPLGACDHQLHTSTPVPDLRTEGTVLLLVSSLPIPTADFGTRQPAKRREPIPDNTHAQMHACTHAHARMHTHARLIGLSPGP